MGNPSDLLTPSIIRFSRGEGVAVLVVKLLNQAISDGDHIYASVSSLRKNRHQLNLITFSRFWVSVLTQRDPRVPSVLLLLMLRLMRCGGHLPELVANLRRSILSSYMLQVCYCLSFFRSSIHHYGQEPL